MATATLPPSTVYKTNPSRPALVGPRTHRFVATSDTIDRYGDVVNPNGAQVENYLRNPVILFGHDRDRCVGRAVQLLKETNRWLIDIEWRRSDLGEECFQAADQGFLNAVSIGFNPISRPTKTDTGYFFDKWEWVETSAVFVPANPDALGAKRWEPPDTRRSTLAVVRQLERRGLRVPVLRSWATAAPEEVRAGKVLSAANADLLRRAMDAHDQAEALHGKSIAAHEKALKAARRSVQSHAEALQHAKAAGKCRAEQIDCLRALAASAHDEDDEDEEDAEERAMRMVRLPRFDEEGEEDVAETRTVTLPRFDDLDDEEELDEYDIDEEDM